MLCLELTSTAGGVQGRGGGGRVASASSLECWLDQVGDGACCRRDGSGSDDVLSSAVFELARDSGVVWEM